VGILKRFLGSLRERMDIEMWQKGWWMLLLIIGTIGIFFAIGVVLMSQH